MVFLVGDCEAGGGEEDEEGEVEVRQVPHSVGKGRYVKISWPAYHVPTAVQLQQMVTSIVAATGQKQILSQESGVEALAAYCAERSPRALLVHQTQDARVVAPRLAARLDKGPVQRI